MKLNTNAIIVANTKGGTGKSTLSTMVLPVVFGDNKEITIYEVDSSKNKNIFKNSKLNFQVINTSIGAEETLDNVYFDALAEDENRLNIVDCGAGEDTVKVLNHIKQSSFDGLTYFIPFQDDSDQTQNVFNTINMIKESDPRGQIYFVFNEAVSLKQDEVEQQFHNLFKEYESGERSGKGKIAELISQVDGFFFVRKTTIFTPLKNIDQTTLYDRYPLALHIDNNIAQYRAEWMKEIKEMNLSRAEGQKKLSQKLEVHRLAKKMIDFRNELREMFLGEDNCEYEYELEEIDELEELSTYLEAEEEEK